MSLPTLPTDKANHYVYGSVIDLTLFVGLTYITKNPHLASHLSFALTALIGVVKELKDAVINYKTTGNWKTGPHGVEGSDAMATAMGALPRYLSTIYTIGV
jgi:hypothetical protein